MRTHKPSKISSDISTSLNDWVRQKGIKKITVARAIQQVVLKDNKPLFDLKPLQDLYIGKSIPQTVDYVLMIAAFYIITGLESCNPISLSEKSKGRYKAWTQEEFKIFEQSDEGQLLALYRIQTDEQWKKLEEDTTPVNSSLFSKKEITEEVEHSNSKPKQSVFPNQKKIIKAVKNQHGKREDVITVTSSQKTSGNVKFLPETIANWTEEDLRLFVTSLIRDNLPQPTNPASEKDFISSFLVLIEEVVKIGSQYTAEQMNHLRDVYGHQIGDAIFVLSNIISDTKVRKLNVSGISVSSKTRRKS